MNKASERRPIYSLTESETLFFRLISDKAYKDQVSIAKNLVQTKAKYIKDNIDLIEYKMQLMLGLNHEENETTSAAGQSKKNISKKNISRKQIKKLSQINSQKELKTAKKSGFHPLTDGKTPVESKKDAMDNLAHLNFKRMIQNDSSKKSKSKLEKKKKNLVYVKPETGEFFQAKEKLPGNLYSDLNFGDMVIAFKNQMFDFMLNEREDNMEKIYVLKKSEKRRKRGSGKASKRAIEKMRVEEEKRLLKKEKRMNEQKKDSLLSLGFVEERKMTLEEKKALEKKRLQMMEHIEGSGNSGVVKVVVENLEEQKMVQESENLSSIETIGLTADQMRDMHYEGKLKDYLKKLDEYKSPDGKNWLDSTI
jgi:hypothetical protein